MRPAAGHAVDNADKDVEEHGDDQLVFLSQFSAPPGAAAARAHLHGEGRAGLVPDQQAGGLEQRIHREDGDDQAACPGGPPCEEKEEDEQRPGFGSLVSRAVPVRGSAAAARCASPLEQRQQAEKQQVLFFFALN